MQRAFHHCINKQYLDCVHFANNMLVFSGIELDNVIFWDSPLFYNKFIKVFGSGDVALRVLIVRVPAHLLT